MNKEDILKHVSFDLSKAKAIHEWLTQDNQPTTLPPIGVTQPVSIHYDENGDPDGIRVCALDEDFLIALHDEFDGEDVSFDTAKTVSLFTDKQVYLYYYYLDDIVRLMKEAGGDPLDDLWYWTKTQSAHSAYYQLRFIGTYGLLNSNYTRYSGYRVRAAIELNTEKL